MQIKLEYEAFEVVDVILKPVGPVLWRLTLSKAHVVDSDDAVVLGPDRDLLSKEVAPGRLTMKQQQSIWARTFVDIMHTETRGIIISGCERPSVVEGLVRSDGRDCWVHWISPRLKIKTLFFKFLIIKKTNS